jgi:hypothetical protein
MNKYNRMARFLLALLLAGTSFSCADDLLNAPAAAPPEGDAEKPINPAAGVMGDTLTVIRYEDGSFVGFYEFSPGELAIRHSFRASGGNDRQNKRLTASEGITRTLDQLGEQKKTVAQIYQALVPEVDPQVFSRLAQADARAVSLAAAEQANPDSIPAPGPAFTGRSNARIAGGCSPDYFNDQYGAQWFIDTFINENRFRKALTNRPQAGFFTEDASFTKVVAMAADFGSSIYFRGTRYECSGLFNLACNWKHRWGFDMAPRQVEIVYIYSSKRYASWAMGYAPCAKVHIGVCTDGGPPEVIY